MSIRPVWPTCNPGLWMWTSRAAETRSLLTDALAQATTMVQTASYDIWFLCLLDLTADCFLTASPRSCVYFASGAHCSFVSSQLSPHSCGLGTREADDVGRLRTSFRGCQTAWTRQEFSGILSNCATSADHERSQRTSSFSTNHLNSPVS